MSDLREYRDKRDFHKTGEPPGAKSPTQGPPIFVVQKHAARRLHYDLRLEVGGVLKSWAIPKGPSLDPAQKRLAAQVEDHPIDYASFEGRIPEGEYGAGEVIVWDSGTYTPEDSSGLSFPNGKQAQTVITSGLANGKISFVLNGQKLKGSWTLVKVRGRDKDWLLIKHRDEHARPGYDILTEDRSVLSGRTVEELRQGIAPISSGLPPHGAGSLDGARKAPFPGFVHPMLASLTEAPFASPDWLFEPKLDGYRVIATRQGGRVDLWSRKGNRVTDPYKVVIPSLDNQPPSELVLDGEMVAIDRNGRISFECMQQYMQLVPLTEDCRDSRLLYYVFDILYLDGFDLTGVRYDTRRDLLQRTLSQTPYLQLVESFREDGRVVFEAAVRNGLEGVIAKRAASTYQPGHRSSDWLKVKAMQTADFIIGGYTAGEGNRADSLGALLLGYLDSNARLIYAGHVGSGFNERSLRDLKERLDAMKTDRCPFEEVPETNGPPTWVKPVSVAEVKYSRWTRDGRLRTPVFLRLRDDKPASEVTGPETLSPPPAPALPDLKSTIRDLIRQLDNKGDEFALKVEDNEIELSNLDKPLWPTTKEHPAITKRDYLRYLVRVSPFLLPHLHDRPLTLSRYPDGVRGQHFWQKHWAIPVPPFVSTVTVAEQDTGEKADYIVCNNLLTLLWLGQAANIEFHTWFSRTDPRPDLQDQELPVDKILDFPDFIIFDIDPYIYSGQEAKGAEPELNREAFKKACEVAVETRRVLDTLGLEAFVKTSGKTGLHLFVPVLRRLDFDATRRFAETVGRFLLQRHPEDITMEWTTGKRTGKVFIDYKQNVRGKTLASVYSARPNDEAGVSFPLNWEELSSVYPTDFNVLTVPDILETKGDLWSGILRAKRDPRQALGQSKG